jgi:nucleoside 2-deoxyribosyltransferase
MFETELVCLDDAYSDALVEDHIRERGVPRCVLVSGDVSGRGDLEGVPVLTVEAFAAYRIYLAAPLFSRAEQEYNRNLAEKLKDHLFDVFLPQEIGDTDENRGFDEHEMIFSRNIQAIKGADILLAIVDGADADSGTSWEMGYARGIGKPVVAFRTDFRMIGRHEHVNLMLEQGAGIAKDDESLFELLSRTHGQHSEELR